MAGRNLKEERKKRRRARARGRPPLTTHGGGSQGDGRRAAYFTACPGRRGPPRSPTTRGCHAVYIKYTNYGGAFFVTTAGRTVSPELFSGAFFVHRLRSSFSRTFINRRGRTDRPVRPPTPTVSRGCFKLACRRMWRKYKLPKTFPPVTTLDISR